VALGDRLLAVYIVILGWKTEIWLRVYHAGVAIAPGGRAFAVNSQSQLPQALSAAADANSAPSENLKPRKIPIQWLRHPSASCASLGIAFCKVQAK